MSYQVEFIVYLAIVHLTETFYLVKVFASIQFQLEKLTLYRLAGARGERS